MFIPLETLSTSGKSNSRFAVEVRGPAIHAEANGLAEILDLLDGTDGTVHIIDRATGSLVLHGSVAEVCLAIGTCNCPLDIRVGDGN